MQDLFERAKIWTMNRVADGYKKMHKELKDYNKTDFGSAGKTKLVLNIMEATGSEALCVVVHSCLSICYY